MSLRHFASRAASLLPAAARTPTAFIKPLAAAPHLLPPLLNSRLQHSEPPKITYPAPRAFVGQPAPGFTAGAVVNQQITSVSLSDYAGKYVVLFFYPKDFTFVCPTEIIAFSDRAKEFEALGAQLIAVSTDTEESHLAWIRMSRKKGGLGHMQIPIVADVTKSMAADYGVLLSDIGIALRGLFIINPDGVLEQATINNLPVGRSVDETLRLLTAFQFVAEHGEVCPANWSPGDQTMVPSPDGSVEYFASGATEAEAEKADFGEKLKSIKSRAEYDAFITENPLAVIDFYAPWCGKCKQLAPYVDELLEKFPKVVFAKVDTDAPELKALCAELNVQALPEFRFFKQGAQVGGPVIGYKKKPLAQQVEALAA